MKRTLLVAVLAAFTLAGCNKQEPPKPAPPAPKTSPAPATPDPATPAPATPAPGPSDASKDAAKK
jgi:hypothetical protein